MSRLLIDEEPLLILPKLATAIGLNEAIILQQVHYWTASVNKKADKNYVNGYYWTYNTYEDWQDQFTFWSRNTIIRAIDSLRKKKLLVVENHNKLKADKTLWYRINYEELDKVDKKIFEAFAQNGHRKKKDKTKQIQAFTQNGLMDIPKMSTAIPETIQRLNIEEEGISQISPKTEIKIYPQLQEWTQLILCNIWETGIKGYDIDTVKVKLRNLSLDLVEKTITQYQSCDNVKVPAEYFKKLLWSNLIECDMPKPSGQAKKQKTTKKQNNVPQMDNYDQREYDEEYLKSFYCNID